MSRLVTTSIVLYKSQTKKSGKHPAKLRVTFNRKQMYYSIDSKDRVYEFTPDEYNKILAPKPRGKYKEIKLEFSLIENKAKKIISSLNEFSFAMFKSKFIVSGGDLTNIFYYFERKIKKLDENEQVSTSRQYTSAMNALKKYTKATRLDFRELTVSELEKYERWFRKNNIAPATIRYLIVPIKTLFNLAQREGNISKDLYPFGRDYYKIPEAQNIKKALKIDEIEKIFNYKCEEFSPIDEAKDLWICIYLMNGANLNDVVRLKWKNIHDDFIIFFRHKTLYSSRKSRPIKVYLTNDLKRIIEKWGNKDRSPDKYIFPILREGMTAKQIYNRLVFYIGKINTNINIIAKEVGINKRITTYTARHSFSTVLKRSGMSIEFISESLGHAQLRTTQLYLDSFEDDTKKEAVKHLTAFG